MRPSARRATALAALLLPLLALPAPLGATPLLDLAESVVVPGEPLDVTLLGPPGHHFALAVSQASAGLSVDGEPLQLGPDARVVATGQLDPRGRAVIALVPAFAGALKLHLQAVTAPSPAFAPFALTPGKVLRNALLWPPGRAAVSGAAPTLAPAAAASPAEGPPDDAAPASAATAASPAAPALVARTGLGPCADCDPAALPVPGAVSAARIAPAPAWLLAGNAGTDPASQFLGTTDAQPLELRVAGQRAFRLEPATGSDPSYGAAPTVLGGLALNAVTPGVVGATIAGGGAPSGNCAGPAAPCPNQVTDHFGTVGGGAGNRAGDAAGTPSDARSATVGGGSNNTASGPWATVGGGASNTASGLDATVGGGQNHTASGDRATVGGGTLNTASGSHATVGGGLSNTASGAFASVPGGQRASARLHGQLAHAAGLFTIAGDAQTSVYVLRRTTTDATADQPLFLDGDSLRLTLLPGRTLAFDALVVGRRSDGLSGAYQLRGAVKNVAGTLTLVGGGFLLSLLGEDVPAWAVDVAANSAADALDIRVTGEAGQTIRWVATVRTAEVVH